MAADRTSADQALIARWEQLRTSPRLRGGFLLAVVALIVTPLASVPTAPRSPIEDVARWAFDQQMRVIREAHPRPLEQDIVLIGIDEETYSAFDEPFALWHRHFGSMLRALARAKPRAIALDTVLPERSYDFILKGSDISLMQGLALLKNAQVPFVYVQTISDKTIDGKRLTAPIQPNLVNYLTPENFGLDQQSIDVDLTSRRFFYTTFDQKTGNPVPTLASQILGQVKIPVKVGYIDYSIGAPLEYIPMQAVEKMTDAQLRKTFGNRIVFVGSLIGGTDRWRLPTQLLVRDPGRRRDDYDQPGVLIHAQVVRSHLSTGLLHPIPEKLRWLAMAIAATAVFISASPFVVIAAAVAAPLLLAGVGLATIVSAQTILPLASIIITFWVALFVRGVFDAVEAVIERLRLQQSFSGQVSPAVLKEMLGGALSPGVSGQLAEVCVLFSDVRDFTTLSENMPPQVVTTVLQRYFDRMVHAVHRYDGTVDKFIGDGMMVLFGAPRKSKDPCGEAVQCALAMLMALDSLNEEFKREGLPTLTIGIGINYGTVTVGNIGSSERHNYSAIGDAVNVAARVEGLTKELGRKIIITEAVVSRIEERFHFDPLGSHKVKGHSPVNVWGIRTARSAPSLADTMEVVR
ncbi:MAG: adenylate/guanylate cyclase domain-containing protein [Usitatibacter sp.]